MKSLPNGIASREKLIGRCQTSWWEKTFQLAGLPVVSKILCSFDIDTLINSFENKILNDNGLPKFPIITSLFKVVSSLLHGNSAPENGFLLNKQIIQLHGTSLDLDTIEALRFVKDTILSFESILDIPITRSFIQSVKLPHF